MSDSLEDWARWKMIDQIVSQQDRIAELEAKLAEARRWIAQHNSDCMSACQARVSQERCNDWIARGRQCPDCPEGWMIVMDDSAAAQGGGNEQP